MKRALSILVVLIFAVSVFAGCGATNNPQASGQTSASSKENTAQATTASPSGQSVTLRFMWWGGDDRHKPTLAAIDQYKQKTGVTIQAEYQGWDGYQDKLTTQLASNTAPDIIQLDSPWLLTFTQKDLFVDLTNNSNVDLTQFDQDFLNKACIVNGKLIGLPTGVNAFRLIANKSFMDKNGVDPNKQYTWDEWFELGKKIHDANSEDYLMYWDPGESWYFFEDYVRDKTGDFVIGDDFKVHAAKQDIVDALTMLKKMYDTGASVPLSDVQPFSTKMDTCPIWINGHIGGMPDFTSKISVWEGSTKNPIETMSVPVPANAKITGATYRPAQLLGVPKCSKNQEEAVKFINWMLTDSQAALTLGICRSAPATKSALDALNTAGKLDAVLTDALAKGSANKAPANPFSMGDAEIQQIFNDTYQNVAYNQGSIDSTADKLISRLQTRLDEMKN